jgi:hypothetical protein
VQQFPAVNGSDLQQSVDDDGILQRQGHQPPHTRRSGRWGVRRKVMHDNPSIKRFAALTCMFHDKPLLRDVNNGETLDKIWPQSCGFGASTVEIERY